MINKKILNMLNCRKSLKILMFSMFKFGMKGDKGRNIGGIAVVCLFFLFFWGGVLSITWLPLVRTLNNYMAMLHCLLFVCLLTMYTVIRNSLMINEKKTYKKHITGINPYAACGLFGLNKMVQKI